MYFADLPISSLVQALNFTPALVFECAFLASRSGSGPLAPALDQIHSIRRTTPEAPLRTIIAAEDEEFGAAADLVAERYAYRGYAPNDALIEAQTTTNWRRGYYALVAYDGNAAVGTVTLGFDAEDGLFAEEEYLTEVSDLRARGGRVCEMVRLAVAAGAQSRRTLAALFNACYGLCRANDATDLVIEVNPRHVPFYRRALGFDVIGEERICRRVEAPSILLHLDIRLLSRRIEDLQAVLDDLPL